MHLFYTPDIQDYPFYQLNEDESKHCIKVLRLQTGDVIYLIDGKGGFYKAKIDEPNPKKTGLSVLEKTNGFGKKDYYIHVAIAPTKNIERLEWFLEKATEIGIDEITPIICDRSERKELKTDRLNKVIIAAVKQSVKAYVPILNEAVKFTAFLNNKSTEAEKYIAHCVDSEKETLKNVAGLGKSYLVLIGPEGDFSESEISNARKEKFIPVSLGNSRLRTETAALETCFEFNFINR